MDRGETFDDQFATVHAQRNARQHQDQPADVVPRQYRDDADNPKVKGGGNSIPSASDEQGG
ncbi:hypothetical protein [Bradyrhizobium iriomotense]|uniref:hypothetical protein n=1 Tax=Bradyrhizobium iriomotense TaxID=441950 RepID=UPI0024E07DA4|nr:hypothetical protein [Bradyrhizobium iriomotense]